MKATVWLQLFVLFVAVVTSVAGQRRWSRAEEAEAELAGKTHYEVLGVPETATLPEIKKAFRTLSLELHPDKLTNESEEKRAMAQVRFMRVVEAFETLKDERKRQWYDLTLSASSFSWSFVSGQAKGGAGTTVELSWEARLAVYAFLFILSVFITLGFYVNVVVFYWVYSVLYRLRPLWKYAVFIVFALLVRVVPTEVTVRQ